MARRRRLFSEAPSPIKPLDVCGCPAHLDKCDPNNVLCPVSTYRLIYDVHQAMRELYDCLPELQSEEKVFFEGTLEKFENEVSPTKKEG